MRSESRRRPVNSHGRARRGAAAAIAAFLLAGLAFAPGASAGPAETAIVQDYIADGHITPCRYTQAQLQSVRSNVPANDPYYAGLIVELNREIARLANGGCASNHSGGGQQGSAYRALIDSLTVASNRRSVKVKLRCPSTATSACKVKLSAKLGSKKAAKSKSSTIARGKSKTVKLKLKRSTTRKLKRKGGTLKISAKTTGSSLAAAKASTTVDPA